MRRIRRRKSSRTRGGSQSPKLRAKYSSSPDFPWSLLLKRAEAPLAFVGPLRRQPCARGKRPQCSAALRAWPGLEVVDLPPGRHRAAYFPPLGFIPAESALQRQLVRLEMQQNEMSVHAAEAA